jgi:hypothetical protein
MKNPLAGYVIVSLNLSLKNKRMITHIYHYTIVSFAGSFIDLSQ